MIIYKKINDLKKFLSLHGNKDRKTGFVPTMGALHPGHISLIAESKKTDALTVCSIFVNPVQFNDPRDYEKYPVTIEADIRLLVAANCDILFLPSVNEIYPAGNAAARIYDLDYLETVLEGKYRPGHFQGVCRVIDRLLTIVQPQHLYLGQKDYQQCMVIKRLVRLLDLPYDIDVRICATLREADGLAMSSRNMRLSQKERERATAIYRTLLFMKESIRPGKLDDLKKEAKKNLEANGFKPDYVEIAGASDLAILEEWDGKAGIVALIAAYLGDVRLIDNLPLN